MEVYMIKEGQKAPDFVLPGTDGSDHNLSEYIGKKVILYFYPKDNTAGCTKEAVSFRDKIEDFNQANTIVIGISRDNMASHSRFINKLNLPFILLSDVEGQVCELYEVIKEKTMFGKKTIGIERSTFIIDEAGIIQKIYRKVKIDGHVDNILHSLIGN